VEEKPSVSESEKPVEQTHANEAANDESELTLQMYFLNIHIVLRYRMVL
jgi:hypothetical protein